MRGGLTWTTTTSLDSHSHHYLTLPAAYPVVDHVIAPHSPRLSLDGVRHDLVQSTIVPDSLDASHILLLAQPDHPAIDKVPWLPKSTAPRAARSGSSPPAIRFDQIQVGRRSLANPPRKSGQRSSYLRAVVHLPSTDNISRRSDPASLVGHSPLAAITRSASAATAAV